MKWLPCLLLILQACIPKPSTRPYKDFVDAQTGKLIAQCKYSVKSNCGLGLRKCTDGSEYECMTNVREK